MFQIVNIHIIMIAIPYEFNHYRNINSQFNWEKLLLLKKKVVE